MEINLMQRLYSLILTAFVLLLMTSCSRKHHPSKTLASNAGIIKSTDSLNTKKVIKPNHKEPTAKVIVVNDSAASKSIDGRLYYDLLGHRYWKNYKDGKYYLYSQSMYSNDDFKPR